MTMRHPYLRVTALALSMIGASVTHAASLECEQAGARLRDVCLQAGGVPFNCGARGANEANECRKRQEAHEKMMEKKKLPEVQPADPYVSTSKQRPVGPGAVK